MHAVIVWWDLARSRQTIESLRGFLREEAVERFSHVPGLRLKFWISDPASRRWGAVLLWESRQAAQAVLPNRAADLIGYPPTERHAFDVEATVEGEFALAALVGRGLALEPAGP
ncbi:YdhR family protein [Streptomyces sp. GbtcB6]|uniref:YdhR family protein n=1 Tax=Streptomyces sp. GbtcB6 TaxID=2824751 RepID=UPI001C308D5B|nr:YdhR family protein [Streptomyces sp. GbtcB6]